MSSITVRDLKNILDSMPDEYEVVMDIKHKYDISKEEGMKGWIAYIGAVKKDEYWNEVRLKNL